MICVGNESVFSDYSAIEPEEDSSAGPDQEGSPVTVRYPRRICALSLGLPASECEICRGDCPDAERYREQARMLDAEADAENQRIANAAVSRYIERVGAEAAASHPHCDTCNEHHSDGWCTRWAEYYGEGEMLYCGNHSEVRK